MLMVLLARRLGRPKTDYRVQEFLPPSPPGEDLIEVEQGHYRIGSRDEPFAYDNELPAQAVELSGFRIARRPARNAEYLGFVEAGGYRDHALWSKEGRQWLQATTAAAPLHWRRDAAGHWYGLGLNGPVDLQADEPVSGVGHREAQAFAAWAASLGGNLAGAVLQHEYQWEVAARQGLIEGTGRVWEWCANPFHPYPQFSPFPDAQVSQSSFGNDNFSLRGASLHTQRCLRRASFRNWAPADDRQRFAGIRLVFPPLGRTTVC
jgi:iron(II)-dependent oxidoreductase